MVQTIVALILYFRLVAHKAACHTLSKVFYINEDMVQILPMLELLFAQDTKAEDLFCGVPSGSEPSLFPDLSWIVEDPLDARNLQRK